MSCFQISTVLPPVRPSPPQDRESAFQKTVPVMHRGRGFSSGIFPLPIQAVRQHSAADRLILLSSIRSLRCRPGIPAPRPRPGFRPHRLCPASPESGPPIPVPSSVVFPYPAYEFPPSAAMPMHGSHVYYTLYLEFLFQVRSADPLPYFPRNFRFCAIRLHRCFTQSGLLSASAGVLKT